MNIHVLDEGHNGGREKSNKGMKSPTNEDSFYIDKPDQGARTLIGERKTVNSGDSK